MPKVFNRVLCFKVEGEIYDNETKAEDILRNYTWSFRNQGDRGKVFLVADNRCDKRGNITKIIPLNRIQKWKKPDTEYFLI